MARLTISLAEEIFEDLKTTKPPHRPMSQHVADLIIEGMKLKRAYLSEAVSEQITKAIADQKKPGGLLY